MNALLDQALRVVLALPDQDQDEIARAMLTLADHGEDLEQIAPEHVSAVREGLKQAEGGDFATHESVTAAFARFDS